GGAVGSSPVRNCILIGCYDILSSFRFRKYMGYGLAPLGERTICSMDTGEGVPCWMSGPSHHEIGIPLQL
ncbi:unnamed protein product, partial [Urochloa humidicola]